MNDEPTSGWFFAFYIENGLLTVALLCVLIAMFREEQDDSPTSAHQQMAWMHILVMAMFVWPLVLAGIAVWAVARTMMRRVEEMEDADA